MADVKPGDIIKLKKTHLGVPDDGRCYRVITKQEYNDSEGMSESEMLDLEDQTSGNLVFAYHFDEANHPYPYYLDARLVVKIA